MTIFNVKIPKAGIERAIDFEALPEASRNFIIAYGARQLLNDATAPVNETTYPDATERLAAAVAAVDKKFQRMLDGDLEIRESTGRAPSDPTAKRALEMAARTLTGKMTASARNEKAKAMVAASPKWVQMAKEAIEYETAMLERANEAEEDMVPETVEEPIADAA